MISSRYYNVNGEKWEARFFRKGDHFPDTLDRIVPKQGVWARPVDFGWDHSVFVGHSWKHVNMDVDLLHFPSRRTRKR